MSASGTRPVLTWPRSDGSSSRWPSEAERKPNPNGTWYELLPQTHPKWALYEEKTAQFLVDSGKVSVTGKGYRIPLPEGYALFGHQQPRPNGDIRVDVYLFGSVNALKFRSTAEFFEHAAWLMDTTRPLADHSQCGCKYNSTSALALAKKSSNVEPNSVKRTSNGSPGKPVKKTKLSTPAVEVDQGPNYGVVPEREIDMTSGRRFRRGELVWFRTTTISPPPTSSNCPLITHWPGLVAMVAEKKPPALLDASGGESSIPGLEYHVRPLGLYKSTSEVIKSPVDLLPWLVGNELLGSGKGWEHLGKEATRTLKMSVKREMEEEDFVGRPHLTEAETGTRWSEIWAERKAFEEEHVVWEDKVFRLGIALKQATSIASCWAQTDKIEIVADSDLNEEDKQLVLSGKRSLYQGLWWGGERIWLEDLVRLDKLRNALPAELGEPSPGSTATGAVFLKIRLIAIELDQTAESQWRCLLYGDVFELVKADPSDTWTGLPTPPAESGGEIPLNRDPLPPKGFRYNQLNDSASEITVDIMDVAGRVYPDLLDPNTQNWYSDSGSKPGNAATALTGLFPGSVVATKANNWKEDLYTIVVDAMRQVEAAMKRFYGNQVHMAQGPVTREAKPAPPPVATEEVTAAPGESEAGVKTLEQAVNGTAIPAEKPNGTPSAQPPTPQSAAVAVGAVPAGISA